MTKYLVMTDDITKVLAGSTATSSYDSNSTFSANGVAISEALQQLEATHVSDDELAQLIQRKTNAEWLAIEDTIPEAGTILIYKDRTVVDGIPVPDIKLADGKTSIKNLPFFTGNGEDAAAEYVKITKGTTSELYLLGTDSENKTVKVNENIKIQNDTITATTFNGTANKVAHTLKIGELTYDGSSDIEIQIYKGE